METPRKYDAGIKVHAKDKRLNTLSSPYFATVKEIAVAMITAGYSYEDENELGDMAIAVVDKLIEKVGEK